MMNNMTPMVRQLLIINIIVFIGSQIIGERLYHSFALYYVENPNFRPWQPLTSMFMHAPLPNFMHILFNMIALVSFGSMLEHFWGYKKFLFFYLSCGIGAALLHTGVNYYFFHDGLNSLVSNGFSEADIRQLLDSGRMNTEWSQVLNPARMDTFIGSYTGTAVGASGAIYGLLVAFAFMFPSAELALFFIPVPIKAKYFVPGLIAFDLFMGLKGNSIFGDNSGGSIAHFAHVGGALCGLIMMLVWRNQKFNHKRWN